MTIIIFPIYIENLILEKGKGTYTKPHDFQVSYIPFSQYLLNGYYMYLLFKDLHIGDKQVGQDSGLTEF